ncbi:unnamed protein product [Cylindrotheca closterium]|uniref:Uncharacterized protein n=1 Tax=Cylindrotheca closterium TaxID=2856 RepID=A0AAD2FG20_9STRA|nr:unnamed protein product [Cylindrotheca closterium]
MTDSSIDFLQRLSASCETRVEEVKKILNEPAASPISSWVPSLISQLFAKETSENTLTVIKSLVAIDDSKYSPTIAVEVKRICFHKHANNLFISPQVVQLWIYQLCCTSHVSVHTNLLDAYKVVSQLQGVVQLALPNLIGIWKESGSTNSIVAIRCATLYLWTVKLCGDSAFESGKELGATDLLLKLIEKTDDPLTQLSVLDLFPQVFEFTVGIPAAQKAWMSQKDVTATIIKILKDPIVGGASMQYLALVAQFDDPHVLPALLNFIRSVGPTTIESERLQVVNALSSLSQSSSKMLECILQDAELRCSWWDVSRTSVPKLKAAILSSIAQTLKHPQNTDASLMLRLYTLIGQDNSAESTTAWMLQKFAMSPMPELRIASYTVWISLAQIPGGCTLLAMSSGFMDLVVEGIRESSYDARLAKFEVLKYFDEHANAFLSADIAKKLKQNLALGPHGMKAQRWEVATD